MSSSDASHLVPSAVTQIAADAIYDLVPVRDALGAAALAQIKEARERRAGVLAEIDQLDARIEDLLAEELRRDLGEDG
ncbi:hypothetical protein [Streptomyces sp. NPDC006147]|uniref:hypothetical protein n=1 Tax=Streptomyces sp. NPDC006147 TaxID=3155597 RepID=UPI00339E2670